MLKDISQCDKALIEKLKGLIIDGEEVPVLYINPEEEFVNSKLPSIVVYRAGIYPDNFRWINDKFYDNLRELENGVYVVDEREAPIPYNIYYGIRLYYQYQMDGVKLNTYINTVLNRNAYVTIEGNKYDLVFVSYKNPEVTYRDFGTLEKKEPREFVEQYLFRMEIELDINPRITKKLSEEIIINTSTK